MAAGAGQMNDAYHRVSPIRRTIGLVGRVLLVPITVLAAASALGSVAALFLSGRGFPELAPYAVLAFAVIPLGILWWAARALAACGVIPDREARRIAWKWQTGQDSELYWFAATGAIRPELRAELRELRGRAGPGGGAQELSDLLAYVAHHGERSSPHDWPVTLESPDEATHDAR